MDEYIDSKVCHFEHDMMIIVSSAGTFWYVICLFMHHLMRVDLSVSF